MNSSQRAQQTARSEAAYHAARQLLPGGVNSPVRAFRAVGGTPRYIARGEGALLIDVDGNEYIDYVASWGPLILGHGHQGVLDAIAGVMRAGISFGAPTELETRLAELVVQALPSVEMVRFVNSGTEATMSAVRLARAATGRTLIIKCEGCYHGHVDALLARAGSGATTFGTPSSPGVPASVVSQTLLVPYNDRTSMGRIFEEHGSQIAALLVEPVAGNMGCIPPADGYLPGLRELCDTYGALLVFDEVITGFRVSYGGAQSRYGVMPDLTCLGKVIGGGLPVGAYGGRRDLMVQLAPLGPVYQAGTLSGNPLAMAAGVATLRALQQPGVYDQLEQLASRLGQGLARAARQAGVSTWQSRVGSMMGVFFAARPVADYDAAMTSDTQAYAKFFHAMLNRGVYLAPSQFECLFVSTAHTEDQIDRTIAAAEEAFAEAESA